MRELVAEPLLRQPGERKGKCELETYFANYI